jgi:hypothetical protein
MRWFARIFTRRLGQPCYDAVPYRSRSRLGLACRQLSESEGEVGKRMNLCVCPSLALIDEELGVIITPRLRQEIEQEIEMEHSSSGEAR